MRCVLAKIVGAVVVSALTLAAPVAARPGNMTPTNTGPDDGSAVPTIARLNSVTYDLTDMTNHPTGKLTGTPVAGGAPATIRPALFGKDVYLMSAGFGDAPPDSVRQWDEAIQKLTAADNSTSPAPPFAAIGNTQELMKLATQLPAKTIVVSYVPDTYDPMNFSLLTMQPVAE
jgi:hypothetical protein